jgi:hypothetical protein
MNRQVGQHDLNARSNIHIYIYIYIHIYIYVYIYIYIYIYTYIFTYMYSYIKYGYINTHEIIPILKHIQTSRSTWLERSIHTVALYHRDIYRYDYIYIHIYIYIYIYTYLSMTSLLIFVIHILRTILSIFIFWPLLHILYIDLPGQAALKSTAGAGAPGLKGTCLYNI